MWLPWSVGKCRQSELEGLSELWSWMAEESVYIWARTCQKQFHCTAVKCKVMYIHGEWLSCRIYSRRGGGWGVIRILGITMPSTSGHAKLLQDFFEYPWILLPSEVACVEIETTPCCMWGNERAMSWPRQNFQFLILWDIQKYIGLYSTRVDFDTWYHTQNYTPLPFSCSPVAKCFLNYTVQPSWYH